MHLLEGPDKGHSMIFMKKKNKKPSTPWGFDYSTPKRLYRDAPNAAHKIS